VHSEDKLLTIWFSLGLIEVVDPDPDRPSLKQVAEVKGVGIGSTMIDRAFELLVQRRLDEHPEIDLPENLAYKLARSSSFQSIKHNFGTRSGDHPVYIMRLDKLGLDISQEVTYPELSIERGKMRFSKYVPRHAGRWTLTHQCRSEIQALFDGQIKGIISRITRQLDWMQTHRGRESVVSAIHICDSHLDY
jgi:hypothetical protein